MNNRYPEILAPAGDSQAFYTAINHGADAVYLGLKNFNARAKAENFSIENIKEYIDYAHLFGVRVYIAFNTLIKDCELFDAVQLIKRADLLGVDAFIIQDLALLNSIAKLDLRANLHASTQMGIHNYLGARIAKELGISRIILSREVGVEDIKRIKDEVDIEIECFVQGALCVAFSGNCYFSSLLSGYSGNRGKCLQLCRKKYTLGKNSGYFLSPSDLSLAYKLDELIKAGVDSFKIEGRLKRAEYVGKAVSVYKKALSHKLCKTDMDELKTMFNRGEYNTAHLFEKTANIIYPFAQGHIGLNCGKVESINNNVAKIISSIPFELGDGIKFASNNIESGTALVSSKSEKADNDFVTLTTYKGEVKRGDTVSLTSSNKLIDSINSVVKKLDVSAMVYIKLDKKPYIELCYNKENIVARAIGENVVLAAKNAPISRDDVIKVVAKTGDNTISMSDIVLNLDENCFISIGELKKIRREAINSLKNTILNYKKPDNIARATNSIKSNFTFRSNKRQIFLQIEDIKQINNTMLNESDYVVYNPQKFCLEGVNNFYDYVGDKSILYLPNIARGEDIDILRNIVLNGKIKTFIVNNLYGAELCKEKSIIYGWQMNLLNNAIDTVKISSIEYEGYNESAINYVFGYLPLMTFTHCPKKSINVMCNDCSGADYIVDEKNTKFSLRRYSIKSCYHQLLNSVPLDNSELLLQHKDGKFLIDLCGIAKNSCPSIFKSVLNGEKVYKNYARGFYSKKLQ